MFPVSSAKTVDEADTLSPMATFGMLSVGKYTQALKPDPKTPDSEITVPYLIDNLVIHGSPKTVVDKLVAFREKVGPFGKLILTTIDWSGRYRDYDIKSMNLLATEVMPKISAAMPKAKKIA